MAAASSTSAAVALTEAHRAAQARRAALIAALVAKWYQSRVNVEDPASIDRWLELLVPKILGERRTSASLAATYADSLRKLELPKATDGFRFEPLGDLDAAVVRASLSAVGVTPVQSKIAEIKALPEPGGKTRVGYSPADKQALIDQANEAATKRVAGSVMRHVQNGSRDTLLEGVKRDPVALGYVRVTKGDACYFCAMLASRGLVYDKDSFDETNARFAGAHNVKVHDWCACSLKPAYRRDDEMLDQSKEWRSMWDSQIEGKYSGARAVLAWRQLYEGREVTVPVSTRTR